MGARASHGGEGSVLGELTARNAQNLGQSRCPVVAIAHEKCRASQHLGCLHSLRAAPWPRAGPSPPPGADLVQREGGGRDASPGTGKATTTTWPQGYHVAPRGGAGSGSRLLLGLILVQGGPVHRLRAGVEVFRKAPEAGLAKAGPQCVQICFRSPCLLGPLGPPPVTSSHLSVASLPSTLPPPLSGARPCCLGLGPPLALAGVPPHPPKGPLLCHLSSLRAGPRPVFAARNSHCARLASVRLSTSFVYNAARDMVLSKC